MSELPLGIIDEALAGLSPYRTKPDPPAVKLDANESPWPLPDEARRRLARVLTEAPLHRYPDLLARDVRAALARRLGCSADELLVGVGSDEVIGILMTAFDRPRPGARRAVVLLPHPSFVMYPITAKVHGLTPVQVPLADDWSLHVEAMTEAIAAHRPNLLFLASPNNPTGNLLGQDALRAIVEAAPDALVVIDEAYAPFAGQTVVDWVERHPNVAVLGTLSKIGLAGLRLGWVRLRPELAAEAEKARPPYNLCAPTQLAARVLLDEMADLLDAQVARIVSERGRLRGALEREVPRARVFDSSANFFLIEVPDAAATHAALWERGVSVRRFANEPRLSNHLRVTVGTERENDALVEALATIVG